MARMGEAGLAPDAKSYAGLVEAWTSGAGRSKARIVPGPPPPSMGFALSPVWTPHQAPINPLQALVVSALSSAKCCILLHSIVSNP